MNNSIIFAVTSIICVPLSIFSMITAIKTNSTVDKLEEVIMRQYDLNPKKIKQNHQTLPYVRRTIHIQDVKFDDLSASIILFSDKSIKNVQYSQKGCPILIKYIGKSFNVDYNTIENSYAINCEKFKDLLK